MVQQNCIWFVVGLLVAQVTLMSEAVFWLLFAQYRVRLRRDMQACRFAECQDWWGVAVALTSSRQRQVEPLKCEQTTRMTLPRATLQMLNSLRQLRTMPKVSVKHAPRTIRAVVYKCRIVILRAPPAPLAREAVGFQGS
jgi:hypothetical protein